jgi:RHS repeat-associated protein
LGTADNGNMTGITNNRDITRSQNFTYDALNRLASAQTQTTGVTIPNSHCWGLTFGYDAWGNLLSSFTTGPAGCSEPLPLNVSATTANQISGYCYDAAGNMLDSAACPTAPNPHAYAYNAENQLVSAASVNYLYDGDGKRVSKSNGKLYWYGMGSDPLNETDLAGNTNNSSFNEYIFFGGKRIARRDSSNNVSYYFADHLGTARVVTNSSGSICYDADFYPFGGERTVTDTCDSTYKFTSKERDLESGLDNFEARYFGSSMGRFMTPDDTDAAVHVGNPQGLNLYSYVQNNPTNATDPDGHDCIYINNDTGTYEGSNTGDCDNSTEERANTGYYVDGSVKTIYTTTGDASGVVTGYSGINNDSGTPTLIAGAFNSSAPPTNSSGELTPFAQGVFTQLNHMPIQKFIGAVYGGSVLLGATGGAACYYLCPAATVTTLGIAAAPLLPIVPSAIQKLQQLGISVEEASAIVQSPTTQKVIDNLNSGNINHYAEVGGKLVRITTNPEGTRIISAGFARANQITNGIANGRFVPK